MFVTNFPRCLFLQTPWKQPYRHSLGKEKTKIAQVWSLAIEEGEGAVWPKPDFSAI